jgi:transcriptional regulator with XRE-family HTH domain
LIDFIALSVYDTYINIDEVIKMSEELKDLFSEQLRKCLENSNITMTELAKKIGVSQATVSDWCNGKKAPRFDKIEQLAKFFNVPATYFFKDEIIETDYKNIKNARLYEVAYNKNQRENHAALHPEKFPKVNVLAAHFEGEEFTEEELEEIKQFAEFVKNRRK